MDEEKPKLQLSEQDGNAFGILARAQRVMRRNKVPQAKINEFMKEAQSGDYDHLLQTCMKWFDVE